MFGPVLQLWLNREAPKEWEEQGALLINPDRVYNYLKNFNDGSVPRDGNQPWLPDVLDGTEEYDGMVEEGGKGRLTASHARQMISALTKIQETQHNLMNKKKPEPLHENTTLSRFTDTLTAEAPFASIK